MARYELIRGKSAKFWEIAVNGKAHTTTYGRIGTAGQSTTKSFDSAAEAKADSERLIASKLAKGYAKVASKPAKGKQAAAKKPPPKKPSMKKTRVEEEPMELIFQQAVALAKELAAEDSDSPAGQSPDDASWDMEKPGAPEPEKCRIETRGNKLRMSWGGSASESRTVEEKLSSRQLSKDAAMVLIGKLMEGNFSLVLPESKRPKATKAELICAAAVRDYGEKELLRIGSLAGDVVDDNAGRAAAELLSLHARLKLEPGKFFELFAVAAGAELADMGDRGGSLIDVVRLKSPGVTDLDSLVSTAVYTVDIFSFWPNMIQGVATALVRDKRLAKPYADFPAAEKSHYEAVMEAAFRSFVRPRLEKTLRGGR